MTARVSRDRAHTSLNSSLKTQIEKTLAPERFRNLLLGIEFNLRRRLENVTSKDMELSYYKKCILLDALSDLANINMGFRKQILSALGNWTSTESEDLETAENPKLKKLLRAERIYRESTAQHAEIEKRCAKLCEEIQDIQRDIEADLKLMDELKKELSMRSDHFALARKNHAILIGLQNSFSEMFGNTRKTESIPQLEKITEEHKALTSETLRQDFTLKICTQVTNRMKLLEESL
jgi:hypothetical protein